MEASLNANRILADVSSFERFFKNNYYLSCLVALRYVKNEQEAEDIVQETFLYLWQKRTELNIQQNLKNYLLNAVKNRSLNYVKRGKQLDALTDSHMAMVVNEDSNDSFSEEELAIQIAQAIEKLPHQCRKIFLLAYENQLTYQEIASILNLSKNTVKTQMGIAYKILRSNLARYFVNLIIMPFRNRFC